LIEGMTGAILNAAGIIVGGIAGLAWLKGRRLPATTEAFCKVALGVFTIFYGLRLVWLGLGGTFGQILRQVLIALLAVAAGKLTGRLLHLQKMSNRLGQYAVRLIQGTKPGAPHYFNNGFTACAILFCASPLGIIGSVEDGLLPGFFYLLAVKAVMDGLAMTGFGALFGWGSVLAALPVFVFQAAITLACNDHAEPMLRTHGLLDSVNLTAGLLACTIGLVIFGFKKVELADFLPSLALAPLLTWLW
jgi:uncharacterized protein